MRATLNVVGGLLLAGFISLAGATERANAQFVVRVLDSNGDPVSDAVVWTPAADSGPAPAASRVVIDQVDKQFVPQLSVIRAGTEVQFPNSDSVSHHVYSFAHPNNFELPLYKGDVRPTVQFDNPGIVTLGCNIHDAMLGYIVVVDTPYFGITDAEGYVDLSVALLPAADVSVWSPRLNPARPLQAEVVSRERRAATVQVGARQKNAPHPAQSSLAWEDY
jgi:plastocyanin